jgi:hypothetical protein
MKFAKGGDHDKEPSAALPGLLVGSSPSVGPRHWQNGQRYTTPGLALIAMVFFRATRSDAKSGVRKGNALPARRFESAPFAGTLAHQAFAAELST